jgi:hypothetical protein
MGRKKQSQISIYIPIIGMLYCMLCVIMYLKYPTFLPTKVLAVIGVIIYIIYLIKWVMSSFQLKLWDGNASNATLTCKNGHTCRVWVNLIGWGPSYTMNKGEILYNVGGHDVRRDSKVDPEFCPECGAGWLIPNKHNRHKR